MSFNAEVRRSAKGTQVTPNGGGGGFPKTPPLPPEPLITQPTLPNVINSLV